MTNFNSFSDEEWLALQQLPIVVASLISAVDYSSTSEDKEFRAFAAFIQKAAKKHTKTPIVPAILSEIEDTDIEIFREKCTLVASALSGEKPVEIALKRIKEAGILVDTHLDKQTAKSFKNFVVDVAVVVARAHKESMLPFASTISKVEDYHIRRIETALGI